MENKKFDNAFDALQKLAKAINSVSGKSAELTNEDGLQSGDYLVWYDYEKYYLTHADDHEAAMVREEYPHWNVYLIGDLDEDKQELKTQTFLSETDLPKLYQDVGFTNSPVKKAGGTTYVYVCQNGDVVAKYVEQSREFGTFITEFETLLDNDRKTNSIISAGLNLGYSLEDCIIWCVKLGFFSSDEVVDFTRHCRDRVESLGYDIDEFI